MRKTLILILAFVFLLIKPRLVLAVTDPTLVPNNRVGIHIFSEKDLDNAAKLVNGNSGDWGYITVVVTEGERDHDRWQQVFDKMRRLHLIPIIRLATKADGGTWEIPKDTEINNWVGFLNSLNWVVQNRYIIIGNEPNHSSEWGGKIDPATYAKYLKTFSGKLKEASPDFFVLPAALDASAKNVAGTMDESKYLKFMVQAVPDVFDSLDGWNSHSYPNPDFSGSETDSGKGTVKTFAWELTYLSDLGVTKKLPVFITETGWSNSKIQAEKIGDKLAFAYQNVWNDPKVVAVTPFILDYPNPPFDTFSWQKSDGSFYPYFEKIQNLPKIKGTPTQVESGEIVGAFAQPVIPLDSSFIGAILARNTGESIWSANVNAIKSESGTSSYDNYLFGDIEPTKLGLIVFKSFAPKSTGIYSENLFLSGSKGQKITNSFPIEAYVTKIDWSKLSDFVGRITSFIPKF